MRGESEKWFAQADAITRQVSPLKLLYTVRHSTLHMRSIAFQVAGAANGPLFAHLARRCECSDGAAVNLLRDGGNLFGVLDFSGNGTELPVPPDFDKNAVLKGLVPPPDVTSDGVFLSVNGTLLPAAGRCRARGVRVVDI